MKIFYFAILSVVCFLPNVVLAAACPTGTDTAPTAGCDISTSDTTYALTGDIDPASGVVGLQFNANADRNNLTLTGNISTTGTVAFGLVFSSSDSNITTVNGNISITGIVDGLVFASSDSNTTTVNGNISTTEDSAFGLNFFSSDSNVTTVNGNTTTAGFLAHGLEFRTSNSNTTTVNGNISTTGDGGFGLRFFNGSNSNTTTVNGNISTTGQGLAFFTSDNNTTTVNGNISTTGDNSDGLLFSTNADSNTIHLNGKVTATGTGSNAIVADATSDNNIIVFNRGTSIIGGLVNDGANNSLTFNLGRAASYNFTTSGAVNWVLDDTTKSVIAGSAKSRGVADMDDAGNRLYQRLSQISDSLNNQQRQISLERDRGDYWIDSYYSNNERKAFLKEIDQNTHGITVGFNASGDRDLAMDVVLNYENSDVAYGSSEQTTKSNSMMVGLFFPQLKTTANGSMAVKFLAGMSDNDRDLIVLNNTVSSGQEIITDQYDSTYVTAGASWIKSKYERERFSNSQFLLSMDINHEQIEASSASAYYHLDDRDITQLVNQAQYSFTMQGMNKRLQLNGSFGLAHTRNIDGRAQTYTIDGTPLSFISEKKSTYTTRSVGATYQLNPLCYAYANAKWVDNSDDINGTTGTVGLVVNF